MTTTRERGSERRARAIPFDSWLPRTPCSGGGWTASGYLAAFAAAVGFLVLTPAGRSHLDHVWAEDGALFLADSVTRPFLANLSTPYGGYLHTLPRLCSELVSLMPLEWAAAGLALSAAVLRAVVALIVFTASGGVLRSVPVRFALAAVVVVLPAGNTETLDNLANLHWFLLFGAFWVLLWRPVPRWQVVLGVVFAVLAATSSPLVLLLTPVALARLALPGWRDRATTIAFFVGVAVQTVAVTFSERTPYSQQPVDPAQLVLAGVLRGPVVALSGSEQVARFYPRFGGWPVVAALVVFLVPLLFAVLWGTPAHRFTGLVAIGLYGTVTAVILGSNWNSALRVDIFTAVMFAQRYSIAPCLFLFAVLAVGLDTLRQPRWVRATVWAARLLVATTVLVAIGLHARVPPGRFAGTAFGGRLDGSPWGPSLAQARRDCLLGRPVGRITQEPAEWYVVLPCEYLAT